MPNNNPSCSRLLVAAGAMTMGLGIVGAHAAPLVQALPAPAMVGAPIPIVDAKGGLSGGGIGADVGADVGGTGAGVSAGADAGGADANGAGSGSADSGTAATDAGSSTGAGADVGGTEAGASTGADDGATDAGAGASGGGGAATGGSAGTGDGSADAGASVGAGGAPASGAAAGADADSTGADANAGGTAGGAGSGGTDDGAASGAGAAPSGDAPDGAATSDDTTASGAASSRATAAISPDGTAGEAAAIDAQRTSRDDPVAAATTVDVPSEGVTGILLPVGPGGREGRPASGAPAVVPRQYPTVGCSDPAETGACAAIGSAQTRTLSRSNTASAPSGSGGVRSGLASAAARPPATQPAMQPAAPLAGGLGISLVDPVRKDNGLVVQGIIVNSSGQAQTIPPMQLSLLDKTNQVVQRYKLTPPAIALAAGAHKTFKTVIQPVPPGVTRVTTAFIAQPVP